MKQYVERGTEWLFVLPEVLMKSIKSHFISVDKIGEVYTISKYNLRTSDKRYEVEKIIKRVIKNGIVHYEIKWKDHKKTTIEPYTNLQGAQKLINEFNQIK